MSRFSPTHMNALERLVVRIQAGGAAQSIMVQLELDEPLNLESCKNTLEVCCGEITALLNQCEDLELGVKTLNTCLTADKRVSVELECKNRELTRRNAELSKENRSLKASIAELMQ